MDLFALLLSARLAFATTLILLVLGLPLAWWLATSRWRARFLVEAIVALPLVLPPTVLGFYLLIGLGPHSPAGRAFAAIAGHPFPFSFTGLLLASAKEAALARAFLAFLTGEKGRAILAKSGYGLP